MNKVAALFLLLWIVGCENSNTPIEPPPSAAESDFKVQMVPAAEPNVYRMNFQWARLPKAGFRIYQVFSGETSKVTEISKYGGTAFKEIKNAPGSYLFFLGRDPSERTMEVKVEVPKDFDGREMTFALDKPVNISGYARVFLKKDIRTYQPIVIQAEEIRTEGLVTLNAGGPAEPADPGKDGSAGQQLFISVRRLIGDLRLASIGQPGGLPDNNGRRGRRGSSGKIDYYAMERTDAFVSVWLRNDSNPQPSRCETYTVKIGTEAFMQGDCTTIDSRISGVYFIAPELYYLHPNLALTRMKERETGISLYFLGQASVYDEGMIVSLYHSPSGPPDYSFGLVRNGYTQSGKKMNTHHGSAQLMHFISLADKFNELYQSYRREGVVPYLVYEDKETIDPLLDSPWNAIAKLMESPSLFASEMVRNETGPLVLRISKKESLGKYKTYLQISGNQRLDDEQVMELIRKE